MPDVHGSNEDTIQSAFGRQRNIERAAFVLAEQAIRTKDYNAGRLVAVHASAASNLARARKEVLDAEERAGRLLERDWVKKVIADHDGAAVALVKSMPKSLAGRIAPHDPVHAEKELERWVNETFLATLHRTNPWREESEAPCP